MRHVDGRARIRAAFTAFAFGIATLIGSAGAFAADVLLTVTKAGSGTGTVAGTVAGSTLAIGCGTSSCTAMVADGAPVMLIATAANGHEFTGWLGPCSGRGPCRFAMNGAKTAIATFAATKIAAPRLDIDGTGTGDALTDGLLILRSLFGLTGDALVQGAVGAGGARNSAGAIAAYLADLKPALDIDGNGQADRLTDGVVIVRYLFGMRGAALTGNGAVGAGALRTNADALEAQLHRVFDPGNQAPVVIAGFDQTITLPAGAALAGSATDDGLPLVPGTLSYGWSQVSGPNAVLFGTPNAAATSASFATPGVYGLALTASDGAAQGSDTVFVAATGLVTQADTAHAVEAEVGPDGGIVAATSKGRTFSLKVPVAALAAPTMIKVTPLTAIPNLPLFSGGLIAAARLEPDGLVFDRPATLTITMPAPVAPAGVIGFVVGDGGTNLEITRAAVAGSTIALEVAHFTNAGAAQAALSDFARDIRPILDSLTIPVSSTAAENLLSRVGSWIDLFGFDVCAGTDLCARAFGIAAESLTQNQQAACTQAQAFIQQGEPFLARTALATVTKLAAELRALSESAADAGIAGFEIAFDLGCVATQMNAISDLAKTQAIADVRGGLLVLMVDLSGDAALLALDENAQYALGALLAAVNANLDKATTACLTSPVVGETVIDIVVNALGNAFLDALDTGLALRFAEARAGCRVRISPALPTVGLEQQLTFTGNVEGINPPGVTWSIAGFALGSTIDPTTGLFTAGTFEGTVVVMATSAGDPTRYKKVPVVVVEGCPSQPAASAGWHVAGSLGTAGAKAAAVCNPNPLKAAGGTFRNVAAGTVGTALLIRLRTPNGTTLTQGATVSIQGPAGFNGGQPLSLTYAAGLLRQFYATTVTPVTGSYTASAVINGMMLSAQFSINAASVLAGPGPVVPNVTGFPGAIGSTWNAVPGVASYLTRVFDTTNQKIIVPVAFTTATSAQLSGVTLIGGTQNALQVFAFSNDMTPADPVVPAAFNMSFDRTFVAASVVVSPVSGAVPPQSVTALTATSTGLGAGGVTWSATGGGLQTSGNTAQWTAPSTPGSYTITATSTVNPVFKARAVFSVNGTASCTPTSVGEKFEGSWRIFGSGVDRNCSSYPPFANFLNGGTATISAGGGIGTFSGGPALYPGRFFCEGNFTHDSGDPDTIDFVVDLGTFLDSEDINVFSGFINLYAPPFVPCHATIYGERL